MLLEVVVYVPEAMNPEMFTFVKTLSAKMNFHGQSTVHVSAPLKEESVQPDHERLVEAHVPVTESAGAGVLLLLQERARKIHPISMGTAIFFIINLRIGWVSLWQSESEGYSHKPFEI